MKCKIKHEIPGRIRLHAMMDRMSLEEADQLGKDIMNVILSMI